MEDIKDFFNKLKMDINGARTRKALNLLERRGRLFKEQYTNANIKLDIKRRVNKEYLRTLKLISRAKRRVTE